MNKQQDVTNILKLYELRREEKMRRARSWFLSEFAPESAAEIINLFLAGEAASANYRMVTSFWEMAASFVINGGLDEKMFLNAGDEIIFVYAQVEPFLEEIRTTIREPEFLSNLEQVVRRFPNIEAKVETRRQLMSKWRKGTEKSAM